MPPKSASRSGKSTPTKGRPLKEEEKVVQDEEELRLKAEEEEKERIAKEEKEKLEDERLEALSVLREKQETETAKDFERYDEVVPKIDDNQWMKDVWKRYMRCDGNPDATSLTEVNTFITLTKEKENPDINVVLEEAKLILAMIAELKTILLEAEDLRITTEQITTFKETVLSLQYLLMNRYNTGTLKLLKEATYQADSETGNLQRVIKGDNEVLMLWGNLNKNPRFKSYEFEDEKLQFELPKVLAMADVAVRVLKTQFDHYSHRCSTFSPKIAKPKEPVVVIEEPSAEAINDPEAKEETAAAPAEEDADEVKSLAASEDRKSVMSTMSRKEEEEGKAPVEAAPVEQSLVTVEEEENKGVEIELDEILDPDVVDLRQFSPLGGVYHIDLLQMPPQPKVVKGWTLTEIIEQPLTNVKYPADTLGGKLSRSPSAAPEARDESATPSKNSQEPQQPPIGITMKLPSNVMFFEEPQVAVWDKSDMHWKTAGITDSTYDEENRQLSFKTVEFGIFSLSQDAHLNMPFQSWELRPKSADCALLTLTAAIAEAEIEINKGVCKLNPPAEDPPAELAHIFGQWMQPNQLIDAMKRSGVNIFPAEDSTKFVSIQVKDVDLDVVYRQMAALSSAFAFSWSKWNNAAPKNQVVIQAAPFFVTGHVHDLDSVPDDDWTSYMVGNDRCYRLALTEFDTDYSDVIAANCNYQCDAMHALRLTPLRRDTDQSLLATVFERSRMVDPVFVHTVNTLLRAVKIISYS